MSTVGNTPPGPDPFTHTLNEGQRQVVEYGALDRHLLVLAPPGSGKTLTITHRIARLLTSEATEPENILALTFTERAAGELVTRLNVMSLHGVTARTFHGYCSTVLRRHQVEAGFAEPFTVWNADQQERYQRDAIESLGLGFLYRGQISRIRRAISQFRCDRLPYEEAAQRAELSLPQFERLIETYRSFQSEQNAIDFDDLIVQTADLVWTNPDVAATVHDQYRFVFVDEFQDVSPDQLRLLNAIAPHQKPDRQVVVVADENQSIYAFRGANPTAMLGQYRSRYRPLEFRLEENRRSVASIVHCARSLMVASTAGAEEHSKAFREMGFHPAGLVCADGAHEARAVAALIERMISSKYKGADIAVLYRRHERGNLIENALLDRRIPFQRVQKGRFYDLPEVQETIRSFELVASSQDRSFVNAVNWPRFLVDELTMNDIRRLAEERGIGLASIASTPGLLREGCSPLTATVVQHFFDEVVFPVREMESQDPATVIPAVLDLLERRRNPIPAERREDLRSTLDELGRGLEPVADRVERLMERDTGLVIVSDGSEDGERATELLKRTLEKYFQIVVSVATSASEDAFCLDALHDSSQTFTLTARAWRLAQRLLMRRETLHKQRFVVYDLETTSNRPDLAEIIEVGAVVVENGKLTGESFHSLVRPSSPAVMTDDTLRIHGIRWEHVADAPDPGEVIEKFRQFAEGATIAGHNIQRFDNIVISHACQRAGIPDIESPMLDTLPLARRLRPGKPNSLNDLLTTEERKLRQEHHRADIDATANAGALIRLLDDLLRDRELDVLQEELPGVAASFDLLPAELGFDATLLRELGARVMAICGEPAGSAEGDHLQSVRELARGVDRHDQGWANLRRGWTNVINNFRAVAQQMTLEDFMDLVALATPSDLDESAEDRVTLMTIYAAKGKEWPVVFMIGLEDDQYPFSSNNLASEVEDGRRSLYVGMTRATERLILSYAEIVDRKRRNPSRFIADLGGTVTWTRPKLEEPKA